MLSNLISIDIQSLVTQMSLLKALNKHPKEARGLRRFPSKGENL